MMSDSYREDPKNVRYIQRCKFEPIVKIPENTSSLISYKLTLEYMGAAEYEFGAFQESRDRFRNNHGKFGVDKIVLRNAMFYLIYPARANRTFDDLKFIIDAIENLNSGQLHLKCSAHFNDFFEGRTTTRLKKGCKKKTEVVANYSYCECWWDIQNDWVLFKDNEQYLETILELIKPVKSSEPSILNRIVDTMKRRFEVTKP